MSHSRVPLVPASAHLADGTGHDLADMPELAMDSSGDDEDYCVDDDGEVSVASGGIDLNDAAITGGDLSESSCSEDGDEPRDYGHKRLVHLFADTLVSRSLVEAAAVKAAVDLVDADDEKYGDLISDHAWDDMTRGTASASGFLFTPPACTFIGTPCVDEPVARTADKPHGVKGLPEALLTSVKTEDLFWARTFSMAVTALSHGVPWAIVYQDLGGVQPTSLKSAVTLSGKSGVHKVEVAINALNLVVLTSVDFTPAGYDDIGAFYDAVCDSILVAASPAAESSPGLATNAIAAWKGELRWKDRLRPDVNPEPDDLIGGLRSTARSLAKLPRMRQQGQVIGAAIDQLFKDRPEVYHTFRKAIDEKNEELPGLEEASCAVASCIGNVVGCASPARGRDQGMDCEVRQNLVAAWRAFASDPDDQVEAWYKDGAPMGITVAPLSRSIFPVYSDRQATTAPGELLTEDPDPAWKTLDAEADDMAVAEMTNMVNRGWIKRFASKHKAKAFVKGRLVVSKLVVISKEKRFKDKKGQIKKKLKRRLILDLKKSGVSGASAKHERVILPRLLDVIFDTLELMKGKGRDRRNTKVRHLVLDFKNAFFHFPVGKAEQRFLAARVRRHLYVWVRAAQGSRGAPLICGRSLAQAMRMAMSTTTEHEATSSCYVDDPIMTFFGTAAENEHNMIKVVACLAALGYDLAYSKAQDSEKERVLTWTSGTIEVDAACSKITASVKPEILADVQDDVNNMLRYNTARLKDLTTLAGRASCISALLHTWRPFVSMLWGPIYNPRAHCEDVPGSFWVKSLAIPLHWMKAFLEGSAGTLVREYRLCDYLGEGPETLLAIDASPLGIGGVLSEDNVIEEFFADRLTSEDERRIGQPRGTSEGQQSWEALCALCALRLWAPRWKQRRVKLAVRSDSVSTLVLLVKLKASGPGTSLIAREAALDIAQAIYEPAIVEHIPGVANTLADLLSRLTQSRSPLPAALASARRRHLPERDGLWWRTVA